MAAAPTAHRESVVHATWTPHLLALVIAALCTGKYCDWELPAFVHTRKGDLSAKATARATDHKGSRLLSEAIEAAHADAQAEQEELKRELRRKADARAEAEAAWARELQMAASVGGEQQEEQGVPFPSTFSPTVSPATSAALPDATSGEPGAALAGSFPASDSGWTATDLVGVAGEQASGEAAEEGSLVGASADSAVDVCVDKARQSNCASWSAIGECENNEEFMQKYCCASCRNQAVDSTAAYREGKSGVDNPPTKLGSSRPSGSSLLAACCLLLILTTYDLRLTVGCLLRVTY